MTTHRESGKSVQGRYIVIFEWALFAALALAVGFLLIDPFVYERAEAVSPEARAFFLFVTNLGTSAWMLIPAAAIVLIAIVLRTYEFGARNRAGYSMMIGAAGFAFISIAGASLIAFLLKGMIGRARPRLYEEVGHLDFQLLAFKASHLSLPSAHTATIFAFATVIAIFWPRGRFLLYTIAAWVALSRIMIGVHYFTDVVLGAALGIAFPYFVRDRFAARRWLFEHAPGGGYRFRAPRVLTWLNWPEPVRNSQADSTKRGKDAK